MVGEDLNVMGIKNRQATVSGREEWRQIVLEAKVYSRLKRLRRRRRKREKNTSATFNDALQLHQFHCGQWS